jgi:hypothetical protein
LNEFLHRVDAHGDEQAGEKNPGKIRMYKGSYRPFRNSPSLNGGTSRGVSYSFTPKMVTIAPNKITPIKIKYIPAKPSGPIRNPITPPPNVPSMVISPIQPEAEPRCAAGTRSGINAL